MSPLLETKAWTGYRRTEPLDNSTDQTTCRLIAIQHKHKVYSRKVLAYPPIEIVNKNKYHGLLDD